MCLTVSLFWNSIDAAQADPWPTNWGGNYGTYNPDHGSHTYCFNPNFPPPPGGALEARMVAAMTYMANATDATTFQMSPCDTSSSAGQTDVVWRERRVYSGDGSEVIGVALCMRRFNNGLCDRYQVTVNGAFIRENYGNVTNRRRQFHKTSCHELGHTLGLPHYNAPHQSCQRSGWLGGWSASWTREWTPHHRGHINDWF